MQETPPCLRPYFSVETGRTIYLSLIKTQEVMRLPHNDGLLFNHVWGKSLRDGSSNLFGIRRHSDLSLCPVKVIDTYVAIFSVLGVDLSAGYLFRPLSSAGKILNKQIANSTWQSRLRSSLQEAKIYEGETLHSFRAGVSTTLALSGSQMADIMDHIGWRRSRSYRVPLLEGRTCPSSSWTIRVTGTPRPFGSDPNCGVH